MKNIPKHIAVIMDGNRRYAKKNGLSTKDGHKNGVKKLKDLIHWCRETKISELTLYAFSIQNFNREKNEKDYLFKAFQKNFDKLKTEKEIKTIKVNVIGRTHLFPEDLQNKFQEIIDLTKNNTGLKINFAMGYGGREEITDALRSIVDNILSGKISPEEIDENLISKNTYLNSEPDLIIRPGKRIRTSNFLLWQSSYSEWIFLDCLWPEFSKEDFNYCLEEFSKRKRNFGK